MALRTMIMRTRAALGTEALATLAAVEVRLEERIIKMLTLHEVLGENLHDGHVVPGVERQVVELGDEDRGHGDEERRAVHVDCGSNRDHELGDPLVHPGSLQALQGDGHGSGSDKPNFRLTQLR